MERFDEIRDSVETFAWYFYEMESPLEYVENNHTYRKEDVGLVMECAKVTETEALDFLREVIERDVGKWYELQSAHTFAPLKLNGWGM